MYFTPEADGPMGMPPPAQAIGSVQPGTEILLSATVIGWFGDQVALAVKHSALPMLVPATAEVNG